MGRYGPLSAGAPMPKNPGSGRVGPNLAALRHAAPIRYAAMHGPPIARLFAIAGAARPDWPIALFAALWMAETRPYGRYPRRKTGMAGSP